MAGIGFELRKLLKEDSLLGLLQAYAYAGIISSGPWVLSILGILIIGTMSVAVVVPGFLITQFQVSVTYIIATSLVLTGLLQLTFTRFTADRLFDKDESVILPNFYGVLFVVTAITGVLGLVAALLLFPDESLIYRLLMVAGFVTVSNIWMATIFLSGMKQFKLILVNFTVGYSATVALALLLRDFGLEGLLSGFVMGQFILLTGMITLIMRHFSSSLLISFDFLKKANIYPALVAVGLFYNLGIWIDKFMFWFYPTTSQAVIGPLRASVIYDIPIFLAYLSIIPGMAVFLVKIETDFVEYYDHFYNAVRKGGSLELIEEMRNEMIFSVRHGIWQIIKIQTITLLIIMVTASALLDFLQISQLYLPLLFIDLIAASLQIVFLGLINIFFYLDKRRVVLILTAGFALLNGVFTAITLHIGPMAYGYGFALAILIAVIAAMKWLDRQFESLEYETFMLQ